MDGTSGATTNSGLCVLNQCVACTDDTSCTTGSFIAGSAAANTTGQSCDASNGQCTYTYQCTENSGCNTGTAGTDVTASMLCVNNQCASCTTDASCAGTWTNGTVPTSSTCDAATGVCSFTYQCDENNDCNATQNAANATYLCNVYHMCIACQTADDCKNNGVLDSDDELDDFESITCVSNKCVWVENSSDSDDGLSGGAIAGIVIGAVVLVAIIAFGIFKCMSGGESDASKSIAYEETNEGDNLINNEDTTSN